MGAFDTLLNISSQNECIKYIKQEKFKFNFGNALLKPDEQIQFTKLFYQELETVINSNVNITKQDISDLINYMLNYTAANQKPKESLVSEDKIFALKILTLLTTKCKIEGNDITRIFSALCYNSLFPEDDKRCLFHPQHYYFWVDNLVQLGAVFPKGEINKMKKCGYNEQHIMFINRDNLIGPVMIDVDTFIKIWIDLFVNFVPSTKVLQNTIKNASIQAFQFTTKHFVHFINMSCRNSSYIGLNLKNHHQYIVSTLELFDKCKFVFNKQHLISLLFDDSNISYCHLNMFDNTISWETQMVRNIYNNISTLTSIINFFKNKRVHLNFDVICEGYMLTILNCYNMSHHPYDKRDNIECVFYGFFKRLEILIKNELILKHENMNNNQILAIAQKISLMPNYFVKKYDNFNSLNLTEEHHSKLQLRQYFETDSAQYCDALTVKIGVCVNDKYLINLLIKECPNVLTKYHNGLKFACINLNEKLIDFYLNNKFEPTQYDVLCLIKSTLYNVKKNYPSAIENLVNILGKISIMGFKMDAEVYAVLCSIKKLDESIFADSINHLKPKMAEIKRAAKPTKNIEISYPAKKSVCSNISTVDGINYMFKIANLQTLLNLYENPLACKPNFDCLASCLKENCYPNVFEYFVEELRWTPTDTMIDKCPNNVIKQIIKLRRKYVVCENGVLDGVLDGVLNGISKESSNEPYSEPSSEPSSELSSEPFNELSNELLSELLLKKDSSEDEKPKKIKVKSEKNRTKKTKTKSTLSDDFVDF